MAVVVNGHYEAGVMAAVVSGHYEAGVMAAVVSGHYGSAATTRRTKGKRPALWAHDMRPDGVVRCYGSCGQRSLRVSGPYGSAATTVPRTPVSYHRNPRLPRPLVTVD